MEFRHLLKQLDTEGKLVRISKVVSTEYELAGIIDALEEKPVLFENVKESKIPVVAGLVSSKELITKSLKVEKHQLLYKLADAIRKPYPAPNIVEK